MRGGQPRRNNSTAFFLSFYYASPDNLLVEEKITNKRQLAGKAKEYQLKKGECCPIDVI
jgi:hypothetical protein